MRKYQKIHVKIVLPQKNLFRAKLVANFPPSEYLLFYITFFLKYIEKSCLVQGKKPIPCKIGWHSIILKDIDFEGNISHSTWDVNTSRRYLHKRSASTEVYVRTLHMEYIFQVCIVILPPLLGAFVTYCLSHSYKKNAAC